MYSLLMIYKVEMKFDVGVSLLYYLWSALTKLGIMCTRYRDELWRIHYTDILWHVKDRYGENIGRNGALEMNFFTMTTFLPILLG